MPKNTNAPKRSAVSCAKMIQNAQDKNTAKVASASKTVKKMKLVLVTKVKAVLPRKMARLNVKDHVSQDFKAVSIINGQNVKDKSNLKVKAAIM